MANHTSIQATLAPATLSFPAAPELKLPEKYQLDVKIPKGNAKFFKRDLLRELQQKSGRITSDISLLSSITSEEYISKSLKRADGIKSSYTRIALGKIKRAAEEIEGKSIESPHTSETYSKLLQKEIKRIGKDLGYPNLDSSRLSVKKQEEALEAVIGFTHAKQLGIESYRPPHQLDALSGKISSSKVMSLTKGFTDSLEVGFYPKIKENLNEFNQTANKIADEAASLLSDNEIALNAALKSLSKYDSTPGGEDGAADYSGLSLQQKKTRYRDLFRQKLGHDFMAYIHNNYQDSSLSVLFSKRGIGSLGAHMEATLVFGVDPKLMAAKISAELNNGEYHIANNLIYAAGREDRLQELDREFKKLGEDGSGIIETIASTGWGESFVPGLEGYSGNNRWYNGGLLQLFHGEEGRLATEVLGRISQDDAVLFGRTSGRKTRELIDKIAGVTHENGEVRITKPKQAAEVKELFDRHLTRFCNDRKLYQALRESFHKSTADHCIKVFRVAEQEIRIQEIREELDELSEEGASRLAEADALLEAPQKIITEMRQFERAFSGKGENVAEKHVYSASALGKAENSQSLYARWVQWRENEFPDEGSLDDLEKRGKEAQSNFRESFIDTARSQLKKLNQLTSAISRELKSGDYYLSNPDDLEVVESKLQRAKDLKTDIQKQFERRPSNPDRLITTQKYLFLKKLYDDALRITGPFQHPLPDPEARYQGKVIDTAGSNTEIAEAPNEGPPSSPATPSNSNPRPALSPDAPLPPNPPSSRVPNAPGTSSPEPARVVSRPSLPAIQVDYSKVDFADVKARYDAFVSAAQSQERYERYLRMMQLDTARAGAEYTLGTPSSAPEEKIANLRAFARNWYGEYAGRTEIDNKINSKVVEAWLDAMEFRQFSEQLSTENSAIFPESSTQLRSVVRNVLHSAASDNSANPQLSQRVRAAVQARYLQGE